MIYFRNKIFILPLIIFALILSCNNELPIKTGIEPEIKEVKNGIRIAWDYSSLTKIAPAEGATPGYYGYARMIQLYDSRLACVYETSKGNVELVISPDSGKTWNSPQIIFETQNNISMAVPEIIELSDHSVLVACNPRPREPFTENRKFGIKVRKSNDGCQIWQPEQNIYEAESTFNNGCWEPSMVEMPNGEIQLFFANEGIYTTSDEQNISMFNSFDFGETWATGPLIIGFRSGKRDGMPVPLLLEDSGELLVAVEDNKQGEFKPTIYREQIAGLWANGAITANDPRRNYHPLVEPLPENCYAGAPYISRLSTGEVLLSYQSTWNRDSRWDKSAMVVEIGDNTGSLFSNRSIPFDIPISKSGLWNSISVIEGNTTVALTSTNAFSANSTEVWMIKGKVIPELTLPLGTAVIDGNTNDECWKSEWPYFVGHKSENQLKASVCADATNLYLAATINSSQIDKSSDGFIFYLDTERKGYKAPHKGIYAFHFEANGSIVIKEGSYTNWEEIEKTELITYKSNENTNTIAFEMAIPKVFFQGNQLTNNQIGINFQLKQKISNGSILTENMGQNIAEQPWTWCPLNLSQP